MSRVLVLEDIKLHPDFADLFATARSELPEASTVVYLGSVRAVPGRRTDSSDYLYHAEGLATESYEATIDASASNHLIAPIDRCDMPFDAGAPREVDTRLSG